MKHNRIAAVFISILGLVVSFSCKNDSDDNSFLGFDKKECEILQQYAPSLKIRIYNSPDKWEGITWSEQNNTSGVRHVVGLRIEKDQYDKMVIPELFAEFKYLRRLELHGKGISGGLSDKLFQSKSLDTLIISGTSISSLPDNIFNDRMKMVHITGNSNFWCSLPESIKELKGYEPNSSFVLSGNSFNGNIPELTDVEIDLGFNLFTSVDYRNAFNTKQSSKGENLKAVYGIYMDENFLDGTLPDYLLSDTLALIHFVILTRNQRGNIYPNGVFSNLPKKSEILKRSTEYYSRHPELDDLTSVVKAINFSRPDS